MLKDIREGCRKNREKVWLLPNGGRGMRGKRPDFFRFFSRHPFLLCFASRKSISKPDLTISLASLCDLSFDDLICKHDQNRPVEEKSVHNFPGRSKEEKAAEKDQLALVQDEYGFCVMDGHKQKVANFRCKDSMTIAFDFKS